MRSIIFVALCFLLPSIANSACAELIRIDASTEIAIGTTDSRTGEVLVDFEPDPKLQYTVLNKTGGSLYSGIAVKCEIYETEGNAVRTQWKLISKINVNGENVTHHPIVVITNNEVNYYQINRLTDSLNQIAISAYLNELRVPDDYPRNDRRVRLYGAGVKKGINRILLLIENDEVDIHGLSKATISVVDIDESGRTKELITLFKRSGGQDFFLDFEAVADLDHDEMGDAFVISHGDFYGKTVVLQREGTWQSVTTAAHGN